MQRGIRGFVLLAAQVVAIGLLAAGENEESKIYECKNANGAIVYQDEPCIDPPPNRAKKPQDPKSPADVKRSQVPKKSKSKTTTSVPKPAWVVVSRAPTPAHSTAPSAPAHRGGPVGGRWETPQKTLRTFLDAVRAGDRSVVWASLTSSARVEFGPDPAAIPMEKLSETVASFTGYVEEGDLGPFWSIRASRAGMRPKWIFFERTPTGEWRIAGI